MLSFQNVSLRRGVRLLLEKIDLTIQPGERWGIVGRNGSGKSSLLALVLGLRDPHGLHPDGGEVALPAGIVLAHVAQETPATQRSAIDYVMDGDSELRTLQAQLAEAEAADDGERQASLFGRLEAIDGYTAPTRAARLMAGLGFSEAQMQQPVDSFSGGWRMRLNLAQALMCRSDLLLLDEPTNHLDLDAVLWLQDWLGAYSGTVLLISHDRDFLDLCVDHIALLAEQRLHAYTGNYSAYEKQRATQLAQQQAAFDKQQRTVAHLQQFVDRFRAKATKARQAQSRLKALARMEEIAPAHVDSPFTFGFRAPKDVPHPLLQLTEVDLGYGGEALLHGVKMDIQPGDRLGLLGPNGAGKSTLIKALVGELAPLTGQRKAAKTLQIGYFAQHQLEQLHGDDSPLGHLRRLDPVASEQELRNYLGSFGFIGDQALSLVAPFSGGEKARLVLALLVYQRPNLLLLDEPTNHLDLEMRHALNLALQDFEGAMLIVSHDRHLLRSVCDRFVLVAGGRAEPFDGDLEDYAHWMVAYRRQPVTPAATASLSSVVKKDSAADRRQQRQQEAERRKRLKPLRNKVSQREKRLEQLQGEQEILETQLADAAIYSAENKSELNALLADQVRVKKQLAEAEEQWMEAAEALELAEQAL
ncbi:MAG: ATP-binding cassette domain-containing protein [Gammaproteobacteria bacterium]|nr:ATP-binding cassette domain-containing protein [Gammaproteobacteria bacterium]MCF6362826.1 ATP-binding cassette domain-containing protein [Gammaproteobacteria bacterium]